MLINIMYFIFKCIAWQLWIRKDCLTCHFSINFFYTFTLGKWNNAVVFVCHLVCNWDVMMHLIKAKFLFCPSSKFPDLHQALHFSSTSGMCSKPKALLHPRSQLWNKSSLPENLSVDGAVGEHDDWRNCLKSEICLWLTAHFKQWWLADC